jgi:hypothetical protein
MIPPSPILDLLMRESHRWENVELSLPVAMLLDLHPVKGRLQSLLSLSIQPLLLPKYQRKNFTLPVLDAFEAPRL